MVIMYYSLKIAQGLYFFEILEKTTGLGNLSSIWYLWFYKGFTERITFVSDVSIPGSGEFFMCS